MDGWAGYKAAPTKTLEFDIVPGSGNRYSGYRGRTGVDCIFNVKDDDYARLEANPELTTSRTQMGSIAFIFNHKEGLGAERVFPYCSQHCN